MSTLGNFDINELILQLHGELSFAYEVANSIGPQAGMQLDNVTVKFGKKNLENSTTTENAPVIDPSRYPSNEEWELVVDYKNGCNQMDIPTDSNWSVGHDSKLLLKRLGHLETSSIKGINTFWYNKLIDHNINNLGELANCPVDQIITICKEFNSLKPVEFQTQVQLLARSFKPLQQREFFDYSLNTLVKNQSNELKRMFKGKLSGPEISDLRAVAMIVNLCLDKTITKNLTLRLLSSE